MATKINKNDAMSFNKNDGASFREKPESKSGAIGRYVGPKLVREDGFLLSDSDYTNISIERDYTTKCELMKKLVEVQHELKAPKGQRNKFGNYNYRSAEDILEAVKPLLFKHGLALNISDDIECIGGRVYVKATVTIYGDGKSFLSATAFAREEEAKKGMDSSQVTGAASSYARKYALNGMFAIDDTKDSDATNTHGREEANPIAQQMQKPAVDIKALAWNKYKGLDFNKGKTGEAVLANFTELCKMVVGDSNLKGYTQSNWEAVLDCLTKEGGAE